MRYLLKKAFRKVDPIDDSRNRIFLTQLVQCLIVLYLMYIYTDRTYSSIYVTKYRYLLTITLCWLIVITVLAITCIGTFAFVVFQWQKIE